MSDYHDALLDDYKRAYATVFAKLLEQEAEQRRLIALNDYLQRAVDLLSMPRITDDDVRFVRDGLLALHTPPETRH